MSKIEVKLNPDTPPTGTDLKLLDNLLGICYNVGSIRNLGG